MSKFTEKIATGYKKIENGVVNGYKRFETSTVDGFNKISDKCVETLFAKKGETVQEAKARLAGAQNDQ